VQLPCRHEFHAECMYKWLHCSSQGKCPLCSRPAFNIGPEASS
jgi:E3 ubiquitin-protein ligase DOA10